MSTSENIKKIRLYGAGGHSLVIKEVLEQNNYMLTEVFDDKPSEIHPYSKNVKQGARENLVNFSHEGHPVIIAVGRNSERAEIAALLKCEYEKAIHKTAIISPTSKVGVGTVIFAGAIIQPNSKIGNHVIINTSASIDHDNIIGNFAHISPKATLSGHVEIGEGTHVGAGAIVIPLVKIGKWCTIGAGTIVLKDVPDYSTVVGNPGRIIKIKDELVSKNTNEASDMTFVGSGISSSFTILHFLETLEKQNYSGSKIFINVIDKYPQFFTGIPYGKRSGNTTLLITSLKDFLVEPERSKFKKWLNSNKEWLLHELKKEGGVLSEKWLVTHKLAIKNNEWDDLFIPRRFFGCYLTEKIEHKIKNLISKGLIEVNCIVGDIKDIQKINGVFRLLMANKQSIYSKKVVLSVGSIPKNYLWIEKKLVEKPNLMFVNDAYDPELGHVLDKMKTFLKNRSEKQTNVLIIGANASGLELMYKLNDTDKTDESNTLNFVFLSTQGKLPDGTIDEIRKNEFVPHHLLELSNNKNNKLTAKSIADAAYADLAAADQIALGPASTVGTISSAFGALLKYLDPIELEKFACLYGNDIGRQQRCAGNHYLNVISQLKKEDRFEHIAGRFTNLTNENDIYSLTYLDTKTRQQKVCKKPVHLVINCIGGGNLTNNKIPSLLKNVMDKGYCKPNESNIGFHVNKSLETINNLHIMGPLLAGNVIDNKAVWHVEHCGRIIWLSSVLSKTLYDSVIVGSEKLINQKTCYNLEINKLSDLSDKNRYKALLKKEWKNNIYFTFCHIKNFEDSSSELKYFLFKKNNTPLVLMPIILRKINLDSKKEAYFDAMTPYGYSGPLFHSNIDSSDLKEFWQALDTWYSENNVITEFIRFNLTDNHKYYTGTLLPTLKNVKGTITNFDDMWLNLKQKVRNNYRKAQKHDLKSVIYSNIDDKRIVDEFYKIFLKTMVRHNAKGDYSYSKVYFQNLIYNYPEKIHIALVYKNDLPISTEFIIEDEGTIYSYLGGTLSDYFAFRPNDFLKIEVLKWSVLHNKKYYVLGGGRNNNDSLYYYKKAFFPKDSDAIFYTGRKIINHDIYKTLLKKVGIDSNITNSHLTDSSSYFPRYKQDYYKEIQVSDYLHLLTTEK